MRGTMIKQLLTTTVTKVKEKVKSVVRQIKDPGTCGKERSSKWPTVRKAYLKTHPTCAACGSIKKLELHHRQPFHLHPELELDPSNFIQLCEGKEFGINCHISVGHLSNFKWFNKDVEKDSAVVMRIREDKTKVKDMITKFKDMGISLFKK
jgi:hypothetical protein